MLQPICSASVGSQIIYSPPIESSPPAHAGSVSPTAHCPSRPWRGGLGGDWHLQLGSVPGCDQSRGSGLVGEISSSLPFSVPSKLLLELPGSQQRSSR